MSRVTHRLNSTRGFKRMLVVLFAMTASIAEAAPLSLLDTPLAVSTPVGPNVLLTFDDSGSMAWAYVPDSVSSISGNARFCSSTINGVYYNPTITYQPPLYPDGTQYPNIGFTSAPLDGFHPGVGTAVNLSNYSPSKSYTPGSTSQSTTTCGQTVGTGHTAFYFKYDPVGTGCVANVNTDACYTKVNVTSTSTEAQSFANWYSYYRTRNLMAKSAVGRAFSSFPSTVRVTAQHLNNTTAGTGTSIKFTTTISPETQFCDNSSGTVPGCPAGSTARTDFYTRLYNSPAANSTPTIPAVQRAVSYFGSQSPTNGAYRDTPSSSTSPERSCRQNFQIIMTDGYWNASTGTNIGNLDGQTNVTMPSPAPGSAVGQLSNYTGQHPYSDTYSNTLADNTFAGWYQDLRTDLANNVPQHWDASDPSHTNPWSPLNDPAYWQHLVTFTIGLGVPGSLSTGDPTTDATTLVGLTNGTILWRDPYTSCPGCDGTTVPSTDPDYPGTYGQRRIDDLWHAALDSRGQYVSAENPQKMSSAFATFVQTVVSSMGTASSVTVNAASLTGNNYVYQSTYNSGNWSGHLIAYPINPTNGIVDTTNPSWDAATQLAGQNYNARTIITYKPSGNVGVPFRWPANPAAPSSSEMDVGQANALNVNPTTLAVDSQGAARVDYIRGDASNEGTGNNYPTRVRNCGLVNCPSGTNTGYLGDTVDSAPAYVGAPNFSYDFNDPSYLAFKTNSTYVNRTPMIYIGANDGMLHGFNANTGSEVFAYVPSALYGASTTPPGPGLGLLTATPFAHHFYVDGDPVYGDAYIDGAWHSILVGGLRKGGQGIYALDITKPSNFSTEASASQQVLWEFTDQNDPDLGYTFSRPVIAKMSNGRWAVIVGNGYNNSQPDGAASTTGHGVLYILFIEDGEKSHGGFALNGYIKIDTGIGSPTTPNGLASPAAVDFNGDDKVDAIYAGDLQGNMWRFDVSSPTPSNWTLSSNRRVIFVAKDNAATPNLQPITTRPMVGPMPIGQPGVMVYFGTGRYLDSADASNTTSPNLQTFYGIWDSSPVTNPTRSNLLQQTMSVYSVNGTNWRVYSNNQMIWKTTPTASGYVGWYLDLTAAGEPVGERSVTDSVLSDGRIIFTSMTPSSDPCVPAGNSALNELDASNGGRLDVSTFDVNGDGTFNQNDLICIASCGTASAVNVPASGMEMSGAGSSPVIVNGGNPATTPTCTGIHCQQQKLVGINSSPNPQILQPGENPGQCGWCRASWRQVR